MRVPTQIIRRLTRGLSVLGLVLAALVPSASVAEDNYPPAPRVIDTPGRQVMPQTDGTWVVWMEERGDGSGEMDIYGARLDDGVVFPIRVGGMSVQLVGISTGKVIWAESPECPGCQQDLHGYRLAYDAYFVVADTPNDESIAAISEGWVAWGEQQESGVTLWARNVSFMYAPEVVAHTTDGLRGLALDAPTRVRLAWETAAIDGDSSRWGIYTQQVGDDAPVLVFEDVVPPAPGGGRSYGFDVDSARVILMTYSPPELVSIDLLSGDVERIFVEPYSQNPTLHGPYVIWEEMQSDAEGRLIVLRGYDRRTGSLFLVADAPEARWDSQPDLGGGVVAWVSGDEMDNAVHTKWLWDVLPTVPPADGDGDGGQGQFFPETGHTLAPGFLTYWQTQGGLPVFGYPLTTEYLRLNEETDDFRAVQYTERQRFEWHPELAGTPYEVLLGRVGAELYAEVGLSDDWFTPTDPATAHYMPETGRAIDTHFVDYWATHGVDLGDESISFRESLALFGYPISPAFEQQNVDGDTVLTQYFERAVFEWHPENAGTEYEVLLRRVGFDLLAMQYWMDFSYYER